MSSDNKVHASPLYRLYYLLLLRRRTKTRKHINLNGEAVKSPHYRVIVLKGKNRRRHENRTLFSVGDTLEGRTKGDLCFAEAYIAAEKSVHGKRFFHIIFYFIYTAKLVLRLIILESAFKIALHIYIRRKSVSRCMKALCIQVGKLLCHVIYGTSYPRL